MPGRCPTGRHPIRRSPTPPPPPDPPSPRLPRRRRTRCGAGAAAEATASAAAAARLVDLGGGVPKRRPDLVDLDLDDGALLAFAGLEGSLLEPPGDDHPGATREAFRDVLGGLAPDIAAQEQRLAVFPFTALPVIDPGRRCHREVGHGSTRWSEPQFGVGGQVSDDGNGGVTSPRFLLVPP